MLPVRTGRPDARKSRQSPIQAGSATMWVERITVRPASATLAISSPVTLPRATGSRFVSGSSSRSRPGLPPSGTARANWARCPPDGGRSAVRAGPRSDPASSTASAADPTRGSCAAELQHLGDREVAAERLVLGENRDPRLGVGRAGMTVRVLCRPSARISPLWPAAARRRCSISVDLPSPLDPTSAMIRVRGRTGNCTRSALRRCGNAWSGPRLEAINSAPRYTSIPSRGATLYRPIRAEPYLAVRARCLLGQHRGHQRLDVLIFESCPARLLEPARECRTRSRAMTWGSAEPRQLVTTFAALPRLDEPGHRKPRYALRPWPDLLCTWLRR